ncbi:hypothetical protein PVW48_12240 [Dinoroseobacter sp. PD6]|uniref:hypothetical protein n=1 Tax=Dinoroseobacter sp. PD6 TaxID=3028384 RepID=UPI00237B3C41|nr:hypothetical protein [Dinoroseobacter sp. PD6]MDD9717522.1 hypothetical protein [Dinoroseobacter sp. PD6]
MGAMNSNLQIMVILAPPFVGLGPAGQNIHAWRGETRTLAKVGRYGIIAAIDISDKNSKKSA